MSSPKAQPCSNQPSAAGESDWAHAALAYLEAELVAAADPERAEQMAAYMRHKFPFFGVQAKPSTAIQRSLIAVHGAPSRHDLLTFAQLCWDEPEREFHYAAAKFLRRYARLLTADDLPLIRQLIETHSWWDTVDELANHVVGSLVMASPELTQQMDVWSVDPNMWVARTAIIHQLRFKESTDVERLFGYCRAQFGHTDFFIRKAIGWALRQYARTDPDAVRDFVATHADEMSGLSRREATKHLGDLGDRSGVKLDTGTTRVIG